MDFRVLLKAICLSIFYLHSCEASLKVLFTAAILEENYASRKADYISNLQKLKAYGCDVYVVESCQSGPTFLDKYCEHVCYTKSNDPSQTKSFNEVNSMLIGMEYFNFEPSDMVIKVTGRYVLEDDRFIALVKKHLDADVIARRWSEMDAYTGYFAIKHRCFIEMLDHYYQIYNTESKYYAVEHALGNYLTLNKERLKIVPLTRLYDYRSAPDRR
jgi:hypothetical protein